MRKNRKSRQTTAKKIKAYGKTFQSKLELFMYKALKEEKIPFAYEEQSFEIDEGFFSPNSSYEKFMNGKGVFKDRGNKEFSNSIYTPDFTPPKNKPLTWVIEVKGRSFPDFPRRWRLFKKYLSKKNPETVLFMPRNQKDCLEVVELIKNLL